MGLDKLGIMLPGNIAFPGTEFPGYVPGPFNPFFPVNFGTRVNDFLDRLTDEFSHGDAADHGQLLDRLGLIIGQLNLRSNHKYSPTSNITLLVLICPFSFFQKSLPTSLL
jgi:hypothetical protein